MKFRTLLLTRLVAIALGLAVLAGCSLFQVTDRTVDEAMTPAPEGRVVRDQYGNHVLRGPPTLTERRMAMWDAVENLTTPR